MIGIVPREVKKAMRTQRTVGAKGASVDQSFGTGCNGAMVNYTSNHIIHTQDHHYYQDAAARSSSKILSYKDSSARNSVATVMQQFTGKE